MSTKILLAALLSLASAAPGGYAPGYGSESSMTTSKCTREASPVMTSSPEYTSETSSSITSTVTSTEVIIETSSSATSTVTSTEVIIETSSSATSTATSSTASAIPSLGPEPSNERCTAERRLQVARDIVDGYNAVPVGESAAIFANTPTTNNCALFVTVDGLPPLQLGGPALPSVLSCKSFATVTREVIGNTESTFEDFPNNRTTVIQGDFTFGLLHTVALPLSMYAPTYLFFNEDCFIDVIHGYAYLPTKLLGLDIDPPQLPPLLDGLVGTTPDPRRGNQ